MGRMRMSRRMMVTLGVLGGVFLAAIEVTVVATAMPTVVDQLGGLSHYSWVFSAYLLTSTVAIPIWGKLSDLYGRRRFFLASVGLFLLGSALSGASQSMPQLIAFRAVQGVGAGGLLPLAMTILGDLYTLKERARMQGLLSGVWGFASIVGPVTGGYVTEMLSWRWVFYLNLPFGFAAAAAVSLALVEPSRDARPRIDYRGAALLTAAVTLLLLALSQSGPDSIDGIGGHALDAGTLLLLYTSVIALGIAFVQHERRAVEPIIPLDFLNNRLVASVAVCGFLVGLYVRRHLVRSAVRAGGTRRRPDPGGEGTDAVTSRVGDHVVRGGAPGAPGGLPDDGPVGPDARDGWLCWPRADCS